MLATLLLFPTFVTAPVKGDADDPAIWVHPTKPAQSLILGTDKKGGRLYSFDLNGKVVQFVGGLKRPNNVDLIQNWTPSADLAVVTERDGSRLHAYAIDRKSGRMSDVSGELKTKGKPMGIALNRDAQGLIAYVSPKEGPQTGYLQAYRLTTKNGRVNATLVRRFGLFYGGQEIESLALDKAHHSLWYSDETYGNRRVDLRTMTTQPDCFNADYAGDHEGIAIWRRGNQTYRLFTNQLENASRYRVFNEANQLLGEFSLGADSTDGVDACSAYLGPKFPKGIFVAMNSKGKNFFVIGLDRLEASLGQP